MRRRSILGVIFLAFLALAPAGLAAQDREGDASSRTRDTGFELQQNYPNPFSASTRIPFVLGQSLFESERERRPVLVTMRIFNILQQFVAHPTAISHPEGSGVLVNGLEYTTAGAKEALWDGRDTNGRQVASGIYYLQLIVNGERQVRQMIVSR